MGKIVKSILGISPYPELLIRRLYYSTDKFAKLKNKLLSKGTNKRGINNKNTRKIDSFQMIVDYIKSLDINKGDILIVHSSMDSLSLTGVSPKQYIDMLLDLVGEEGTLVIPAFPLYRDRDLKNFNGETVYIYNPNRIPSSTGMIPNIFLRYPGVIRSNFPWNSLCAKGKYAEAMMENNMDTDLVHGKNSAWAFCLEHHAKILLLGVHANHTTTAVHAAEDLMDEEWPVANWYERTKFLVKTNSQEQIMDIRIRKQFWSRFVTSHYRSRVFIKNNLLKETEIEGINIGFIPDSKAMVDFLIDCAKEGKLFFKVPRKYLK